MGGSTLLHSFIDLSHHFYYRSLFFTLQDAKYSVVREVQPKSGD